MFSFNLPLLNRPILWYGFFFALGFFLGFWVLRYLLSQREGLKMSGKEAAERITFYVLMGAVIGARLGDVLFYQDFSCFLHNPLAIIKFWEGGLASHGGAVGILAALALLSTGKRKEKLQLSFRNILDLVVIPTALAGALIRVGNFFNQEILGKATTLPWGVRFLHPVDGSAPIVRHPVQIYEALFYFGLFLFFLILWKRRPSMRAGGRVSGLFIILMFTFRFLIEFIKTEQSIYIAQDAWLTMGQYLSLPFIGLGLLLFFSSSTSFHQNLAGGLRQSPGIEIVEDGGSITAIQPPSSTTQSRELSRNSTGKVLMKRCTRKLFLDEPLGAREEREGKERDSF